MRLPGVSLALVVWVLLSVSPAPAEARAAGHEPVVVTNCMDLSNPRTADTSGPPAPEDVLPAAARPVPTPLDARNLADKDSYADVIRILREDNKCSRFFGGPALAVEAFNQFARQLGNGRLGNPTVAIRMSGGYTRYMNHETGASYRLFQEATINRDGPFGPRPTSMTAARLQVGRYSAYTPQARALVLLHELGHLVQGPSGDWLLPNDGNNTALSERNTKEVEAHCIEQLKGIRD